eukprot:Gb_06247 [translate_table: standard]
MQYPQRLLQLPQARCSIENSSLPRVASIGAHNPNRTPISSDCLSHSVFYLVLLYSTACWKVAGIYYVSATRFTATTTINQPPPKEEIVLPLPPELICITQMLGLEYFLPIARLVRINCPSTVLAIKALTCPFYVLLGGNLAHVARRLVVGEVNAMSSFLHHSSSTLAHGFHLTLSIQPLVVEL